MWKVGQTVVEPIATGFSTPAGRSGSLHLNHIGECSICCTGVPANQPAISVTFRGYGKKHQLYVQHCHPIALTKSRRALSRCLTYLGTYLNLLKAVNRIGWRSEPEGTHSRPYIRENPARTNVHLRCLYVHLSLTGLFIGTYSRVELETGFKTRRCNLDRDRHTNKPSACEWRQHGSPRRAVPV